MEFRMLQCGTVSYGSLEKNIALTQERTPVKNVCFESSQFWTDFMPDQPNYANIERMILGITLNHGIMLDQDGNYLASSPDELSLLNAAKYMGVTMVKQSLQEITISFCNREQRNYKILFTIEFTSTRKRMTTVLKTPEGKVLVLTKGADTICLPLTREVGS